VGWLLQVPFPKEGILLLELRESVMLLVLVVLPVPPDVNLACELRSIVRRHFSSDLDVGFALILGRGFGDEGAATPEGPFRAVLCASLDGTCCTPMSPSFFSEVSANSS